MSTKKSQLTAAEFKNICEFLGYGSLNAPVWFLGIEEGGGDVGQLFKRTKWRRTMDCEEAHKDLGITKFCRGKKPPIQSCRWRLSASGTVGHQRENTPTRSKWLAGRSVVGSGMLTSLRTTRYTAAQLLRDHAP